MRFILPIILIAIAVVGFLLFTSPIYQSISTLRTEAASYDAALSNSKALENERDKLTSKYNSFTPDDLDRIKKLLPDNIDNIRLILEIEKIAQPYGMVIKDVKFNADDTTETKNNIVQGGRPQGTVNREYNVLNMEFTTTGTYANYLKFLNDLESNLRIIDIASVTFTSDQASLTQGGYKYNFSIKTYWLKN